MPGGVGPLAEAVDRLPRGELILGRAVVCLQDCGLLLAAPVRIERPFVKPLITTSHEHHP